MADSDGDNLEPLDFDLPDDDLNESGDELAAADGLDLDPVDEAPLSEEPEDDELVEAPAKPGKKKKKKEKKPKAKKEKKPKVKKEKKPKVKKEKVASEGGLDLVAYLTFAFCAICLLAVLAVDAMAITRGGSGKLLFVIFFTILGLIGTAIPFMLWKGRETNSVFVVFLGISLAGILLANILLLMELSTYGGNFGAKGALRNMSQPPAVQSAPDNATATV